MKDQFKEQKPQITSETPVVDVIVVGAGLSGLQAAYDIQKAGLSCRVLEARERVGGKTWTKETSNGKLVDVGAAWINDTNQSKIYELAKRFNLDLIEQNTTGDCVMQLANGETSRFEYGALPKFTPEEGENTAMIRDFVERLSHANIDEHAKYDGISFQELLKNQGAGETALSLATLWTRVMLGCEPGEVSAMYVLSYYKCAGGLLQARSDRKDGGQYLRIRQGTQEISKSLAESLTERTLFLNSPVIAIEHYDPNVPVLIRTKDRQYFATKVILAIPSPLYSTIDFSPPLAQNKGKIDTTKLGFYAKSILVYKRSWWRESSFCGLTQSFAGPASVTRDTSDDEVGQYSLTCFIVGEMGREWSAMDPEARKDSILSQMVALFGKEHQVDVYDFVDIVEQDWMAEEWSRGAPCPVLGPGGFCEVGPLLARPVENLHFVGTESADVWRGYMEGALRSGERGAQEVIDSLLERSAV